MNIGIPEGCSAALKVVVTATTSLNGQIDLISLCFITLHINTLFLLVVIVWYFLSVLVLTRQFDRAFYNSVGSMAAAELLLCFTAD